MSESSPDTPVLPAPNEWRGSFSSYALTTVVAIVITGVLSIWGNAFLNRKSDEGHRQEIAALQQRYDHLNKLNRNQVIMIRDRDLEISAQKARMKDQFTLIGEQQLDIRALRADNRSLQTRAEAAEKKAKAEERGQKNAQRVAAKAAAEAAKVKHEAGAPPRR